ncbi:winged helix-turn-helix transcriptional regulator [Priestia megaterium]
MTGNWRKKPDEICSVLYTISILGQRWKFPILWHLADEGPLRYNELKRGIPLITNIMLNINLKNYTFLDGESNANRRN